MIPKDEDESGKPLPPPDSLPGMEPPKPSVFINGEELEDVANVRLNIERSPRPLLPGDIEPDPAKRVAPFVLGPGIFPVRPPFFAPLSGVETYHPMGRFGSLQDVSKEVEIKLPPGMSKQEMFALLRGLIPVKVELWQVWFKKPDEEEWNLWDMFRVRVHSKNFPKVDKPETEGAGIFVVGFKTREHALQNIGALGEEYDDYEIQLRKVYVTINTQYGNPEAMTPEGALEELRRKPDGKPEASKETRAELV